MPTPFPGMDSYLEQPVIWSDLHLTLIVAIRAELNIRLPKGYLAAADRHVWIEDTDEGSWHVVGPDVHVSELGSAAAEMQPDHAALAVLPQTVTLPVRGRDGEPYLKIVDAEDRQVITIVELLSPSNKSPGDKRNAYLAKREEYLAANVNFVEINLLRAGKLPPMGRSRLRSGAYFYLVCRAEEMPTGNLWTFGVRDRLPELPIPLRAGESVVLNLRVCLDRAYQEARYDLEIDYSQPPLPKLNGADASWVKRLLKSGRNRA